MKFIHLASDKKIMGGALCIKGSRVPITIIMQQLANGKRLEDIIATSYPWLGLWAATKALREIAHWIDSQFGGEVELDKPL